MAGEPSPLTKNHECHVDHCIHRTHLTKHFDVCYNRIMGRYPNRETPSNSVQKYGLSYIRPYHQEIARRLILGQTQSAICKHLGISTSRMSIICNSPLFKMHLKRLEDMRDKGMMNVQEQLAEIAPVALETLERTMYEGRSDRLKFDAACSLLDRAGFGAISKGQLQVQHKGSIQHHNLTDDELRLLITQRLERMKMEAAANTEMVAKAGALSIEYDDVIDSPPPQNDNYCSPDEHKYENGAPIKVLKT